LIIGPRSFTHPSGLFDMLHKDIRLAVNLLGVILVILVALITQLRF
jgi:hypothetical protein